VLDRPSSALVVEVVADAQLGLCVHPTGFHKQGRQVTLPTFAQTRVWFFTEAGHQFMFSIVNYQGFRRHCMYRLQ